jgi:hypothetical protein
MTPLAWLQANSHYLELELQPQRRHYRTIADEFATLDGLDAVDEEDLPPPIRAECLAHDSLVVLHVYKDTMVGFYSFYHYDAEACVAEAYRQLSGGGQ